MLNKGFTLIETLLIILLLGLFNLLTFTNKIDFTFLDQVSINHLNDQITNIQLDSLLNKERHCLDDYQIISKYPICFNQNGNINISQKVALINNNFKITIFLGAGTHEIK